MMGVQSTVVVTRRHSAAAAAASAAARRARGSWKSGLLIFLIVVFITQQLVVVVVTTTTTTTSYSSDAASEKAHKEDIAGGNVVVVVSATRRRESLAYSPPYDDDGPQKKQHNYNKQRQQQQQQQQDNPLSVAGSAETNTIQAQAQAQAQAPARQEVLNAADKVEKEDASFVKTTTTTNTTTTTSDNENTRNVLNQSYSPAADDDGERSTTGKTNKILPKQKKTKITATRRGRGGAKKKRLFNNKPLLFHDGAPTFRQKFVANNKVLLKHVKREIRKKLKQQQQQQQQQGQSPQNNTSITIRKEEQDDEALFASYFTTHIDRIYYINMDHRTGRRDIMESWLSQQPIPYQRVAGQRGENDTCVPWKLGTPCVGLSGLANSNVYIMDHWNTTGLTLVLEDDFVVTNMEKLLASVHLVPSDWDVIRWDCWHTPPLPHFETYPFSWKATNTYDCQHKNNDTTNNGIIIRNRECEYWGGTHAVLWKGGKSVEKLRRIWTSRPLDDIDGMLMDNSINSYCIQVGVGATHAPPNEIWATDIVKWFMVPNETTTTTTTTTTTNSTSTLTTSNLSEAAAAATTVNQTTMSAAEE